MSIQISVVLRKASSGIWDFEVLISLVSGNSLFLVQFVKSFSLYEYSESFPMGLHTFLTIHT